MLKSQGILNPIFLRYDKHEKMAVGVECPY